MASFAQDKGKRAEREVVRMLQPVVTKCYEDWNRENGIEAGQAGERVAPQLERNLMQSHKGGHDIVGLEWLALEVKHHENLQTEAWWLQSKEQASKASSSSGLSVLPVLIYKQNRVKWRVRMFGYLDAGTTRVRCPVDISVEAFLVWFESRLSHELSTGKEFSK